MPTLYYQAIGSEYYSTEIDYALQEALDEIECYAEDVAHTVEEFIIYQEAQQKSYKLTGNNYVITRAEFVVHFRNNIMISITEFTEEV